MVPDQAKARRGTERGPSETGQRAMLAVSGDGGGGCCAGLLWPGAVNVLWILSRARSEAWRVGSLVAGAG